MSSTTTSLKPYLELKHRLSLVWLAYPILSLLFIAFRLSISSSEAQVQVDNAKADLLLSCQAAEKSATSAASLPRYMAAATNRQFASAVNGSMEAARVALVLALTVMEAIINFIIGMYRSTFLCFLELVVRGGLSLIIGAVDEINKALSTSLSAIRTSIQNDIGTFNNALSSATSVITKIPGIHFNAPQLSIPSLDALNNVTLPSDFTSALTQLNSSLPTVAQLKNTIEDLVDTPFELVKKEINDTLLGLKFDENLIALPDRNNVTFCHLMDTSVVDDIATDLVKIYKIGIILIGVAALLLIAAHCALEWYKWRCQLRHFRRTREAWASDPTITHVITVEKSPNLAMTDHNLLILQADSEHPLLTRIANTLSTRMRLSQSQHINLRWFFHYIFHPPATVIFLIGVFGLLSVELQLLALHPLEAKFADRTKAAVTDFSNTIATSINASMYNQSSMYANDVNSHVDAIQTTINDGLFGWVNGTTTEINSTIATFYSDIQNAVTSVLGGTILEQPAQEFLRCFLGTKVYEVEKALTFLHNNLLVDIPRMNESVLVLSPDQVQEATTPIAAAAVGGGSNDNGGIVGRIVNTYISSLKKERIMFLVFLALWIFVVIIALCVIFYHSYIEPVRAARKRRQYQREQREGFENIVIPFRLSDDKGSHHSDIPPSEKTVDLPDLTPLPSPVQPSRESSHALDTLDPRFEKSSENFFSPWTLAANPSRPIRVRLANLGRKKINKNELPSHIEKSLPIVYAEKESKPSLWERCRALFSHSSEGAEYNNVPWIDASSTHSRDASEVFNASKPMSVASLGSELAPVSRPTWTGSAAKKEKQTLPPPPPSSHLSSPLRRKASVPWSVTSREVQYEEDSSDDEDSPISPIADTPLAVPLHYTNWSTPAPAPVPQIQPRSPIEHQRSTSVPMTISKPRRLTPKAEMYKNDWAVPLPPVKDTQKERVRFASGVPTSSSPRSSNPFIDQNPFN